MLVGLVPSISVSSCCSSAFDSFLRSSFFIVSGVMGLLLQLGETNGCGARADPVHGFVAVELIVITWPEIRPMAVIAACDRQRAAVRLEAGADHGSISSASRGGGTWRISL